MKPTIEQIEQYRKIVASVGEAVLGVEKLKQIITLHDENQKLREALDHIVEMDKANTGAEPSLSCFYRAIDDARELLK